MSKNDEENTSDNLWVELKDRARGLVEQLEIGDSIGVNSAIESLNEARNRNIYVEVGRLTRGLHDAIVNFDIEANVPGQAGGEGDENLSKMANAQDRLGYVIDLTQNSANKTMDMVEESIPIASQIRDQSTALKADWERLLRREMNPDEFRELYKRIDQFLKFSSESSDLLSEKMNTILLAQDFQDLTGQVIKKVISMVQEVEERLVELMRVAGQVEELTGIVRNDDATVVAADPTKGEGPQINKENPDVVSGQDDVDDLLSSLGF